MTSSSCQTSHKVLQLNDKSVDVVSVRDLNLFIITDVNNLGSNWIQVLYSDHNQIYTTKCLMGAEEETMAPLCRYLAETIVNAKTFKGQTSGADQHICLTFNIALKHIDIKDVNSVRTIGQQLVDTN